MGWGWSRRFAECPAARAAETQTIAERLGPKGSFGNQLLNVAFTLNKDETMKAMVLKKLNQANQALADLRAGWFEGAAVLVP